MKAVAEAGSREVSGVVSLQGSLSSSAVQPSLSLGRSTGRWYRTVVLSASSLAHPQACNPSTESSLQCVSSADLTKVQPFSNYQSDLPPWSLLLCVLACCLSLLLPPLPKMLASEGVRERVEKRREGCQEG